ncbi:MAG: ketoacyl-ACP synthase III [Acidobacteriales bacterium]|nr:ketoacyl-ACP synthase III [Terriglobales bacterium]
MASVHSGTTILGLAAVLPAGVVDNEEIARRFGERETASAIKMSGVRERRVTNSGQCASDLALTAAERLIQSTGFDRSLIDLLIFVSQTPDYKIPTTASVLHGKLGLRECCATFDVNQACSAYPYSLSIAHSMISSGVSNYALVLNGDTLTKLIHPRDRSLAVLHGDAAAATIVGPCAEGYGLEGFVLGTAGSGAKHLLVPAGGSRLPCGPETRDEQTDESGCVHTDENLVMDGPAVFHFSVYKVPEAIRGALSELGLTIDDIDTVILHQANKTMMDLIYRTLRVPPEKRFYCIEQMGNSSGPSTPVALAEAWRQGKVRPGSRTLMCSFGAGLTWGVAVIRWPADADPVHYSEPVVPDEEMLSAAL